MSTARQVAVALLIAAVPATTIPATAQYRAGLTVRVTTRQATQSVVGLLRGSDSSSITVDSAVVPFSVISRVQVYQGTGGYGGEGGLVGAIVGFIVGYGVGEASGDQGGPGYGLVGGIVGAPILGLVGLVCGAGFPVERWSEIPLEQLRSGGAPRWDGRVRIGFRVEF